MDVRLLLAVLAVIMFAMRSAAAEERLPISTGNFSVMWIQHCPVGAFPDPNFNGEPVPPPDNWAGYHKNGVNAYEDYVAWGGVEREPGKWDWRRQIEVADSQRAGGLEYDPYLWIHNPPMWMRSWDAETGGHGDGATGYGSIPGEPDAPDHYTVMRCLEHDEETQTFSIWDPATLQWFERYYRECHKAMGDKIGRIYVALVGPYAEGNYPLPIFDFLKIGHCHEGYWCGDAYARKAFVQSFKKRYRTLGALNKAWGTKYAKWDDVTFPEEIKAGKLLKAEERTEPKARRRWVDFIEWYHQSLIDFSVEVAKGAMKYFPVEKLKMKPGGAAGGVNPIAWGTYCPGYAKAFAAPGYRFQVSGSGASPETRNPKPVTSTVRMQPADCHGTPFADRWYGTAYRFYGIPFTTEPAGGMDEKTFRRRVFMDASNGCSEMFSYEWEQHMKDGLKWIHLYRGVPSITDVAVLCPTTWYRMNGDVWPVIRAADAMRDMTDFEVADELLIKDDYLAKSKTRVLIWMGGPVVDRPVLEKIVRWVERGGILVANMTQPPVDIEGRTDLGQKLFPPVSQDKPLPTTMKLGKGVVVNDAMPDNFKTRKFAEMVKSAVYSPGTAGVPPAIRDAGKLPALHGAPDVDSEFDGVWTAVFPDMLLLFNSNDKPVDVKRTWNGKEYAVHIEAGELAEVKRDE